MPHPSRLHTSWWFGIYHLVVLLCGSDMFNQVQSAHQPNLDGQSISRIHRDGNLAMAGGEVAQHLRASPRDDEDHFGEAGQRNDEAGRERKLVTAKRTARSRQPLPRLKDCILLFGAFCNGNLGDVIQAAVMEELLDYAAPGHCFWYAHPWKEFSKGIPGVGKFFGKDSSRVIALSPDSAHIVNRFKALVVGGGGIFVAQHAPLESKKFAEAVTIPIVIMGVGASHQAKKNAALIRKAVFVSGRDEVSATALRNVLKNCANPVVKPEEVQIVRDPVISDKMLSDIEGTCWRQSEGDDAPLCFVLPASSSESLRVLHRNLVENVVQEGDVFINVFPKHQQEVEAHGYPGPISVMLEPAQFTQQLCQCGTIFSGRLHGAVLGLHMGVPTLGAWHVPESHKITGLMKEVMQLPDQFVLINENLTRADLDAQVALVKDAYSNGNRRTSIHALLATFFDDFAAQATHVMRDIVGVRSSKPFKHKTATVPDPDLNSEGKTVTLPATLRVGSEEEMTMRDWTKSVSSLSMVPARQVPAFTGANSEGKTVALPAIRVESEEEMTMRDRTKLVSSLSKMPARQVPAFTGTGTGSTYSAIMDYGVGAVLVGFIVALSLRRSRDSDGRSKPNGVSSDSPGRGEHVYSAVPIGSAGEEGNGQGGGIILSGKKRAGRVGFLTSFSPGASSAAGTITRPPSQGKPLHGKLALAVDFAVWVSLAVGFSAYGKGYLHDTRDPVGLLVLQGLTGVIVLAALGRYGILDLNPGQELRFALRGHVGWAAILHTSQALLTNLAVLFGGVAVTNAVKAMEPVAAAAFSYILLGKECSRAQVVAIFTIVGGIILMTSRKGGGGGGNSGGGRGDGNGAMLISAAVTIAAVCCNALRNVVLKKRAPIPSHVTLFVCSAAAAVVGAGVIVIRGALCIAGAGGGGNGGSGYWLQPSGINAALCFVGYNFASFNLLASLSPVGHAVGNSCKRIIVFASGLLMLREVMSVGQLVGAAVALLGVMAYNCAGL